MDEITAGLILKTATSGGENGNNIAADLYKEFNSKQSPAHAIAQSHAILKELGYKEGAIVELMYGMGAIGKIVGFRTSTSGLYDGLRYPLRVQGPGGIYEQSVFISHYEDVPKFKDNPQQLLEIYKDDLALKLIPDIENPKEVMRAQSELSEKKNIYDLIEFLDTYETPVGDKVDYIYKYALASLEKAWDKELKLISKAYDFIESKDFYSIQKTEIKSFMLSKFKNKIESKWTTVNDLVSIYTYIREPFYKVIVKVAIIDRARDMDDTELYNTATAFKGTDIEGDILALLEAKIS